MADDGLETVNGALVVTELEPLLDDLKHTANE